MIGNRRGRSVRIGSWFAVGAAVCLLGLPSPASAEDAFDKALAEIEATLEANPHGVPPDSLKTCRSMIDTAKLLRKMGRNARAVRRINGCRRLLGLETQGSRGAPVRVVACLG